MDAVEENIRNRRSIRKYSDKEIPDEYVDKLLRAAMQAAGSRMGAEPWEFIVVKDKETIGKLSELDSNTKPLKTATLAIVSIANMERVHYERVWQQDMAAASENLLLEAANLGLGAVWLGIAPVEERMNKIREIFNLESESLRPFNIISLGYPAEGFENKFVDKYDETRVHYETY
ncbi:FMN reductase (NADPH) [Methanobrevibacter woesei]|uniref:FMN reductase (NADPH) n=1 Tax=Methanobrevibacter woesei TaxID=190976 RepID=A0A2U1S896_9EURY|nr:nitroreductase family protein [Methanobrevibacter woesei]MCC9262258.1 nitroreductase family protein [Methanobrevibacter woesei]MCI7291261.1 nitroreductase family protein [Methanobrevibacter woesei]PWB86208.1 FMN reductase (NADPH) [Methanobrevibacter woesei]